eukprot:Skav211633  [mRNA]  locus=scaffold2262:125553:128888:+ [translate_table: standard]
MHAPAAQHQRYRPDVPPLEFLQLATWNVRGKSLFQIADVLSDQGIHFDAIALQEVGGLSQGTFDPTGFLHTDDPAMQMHDELGDYWIIATDQLDSHLGQAILIDKSFATGVLATLKGSRFIGARLLHTSGLQIAIVSGHMPHHHQPLSQYTDALQDLRQLLRWAQPFPTVIAADWNATPHQPNLDEQALQIACLEAEAELLLLLPEHPTWKNRIYDFIALTPALQRILPPSSQPPRPTVVTSPDALLPTDHKMVQWETAFQLPRPRTQLCRHPRHTNKWQLDVAKLHAELATYQHEADWQDLCKSARACQTSRTSRKYRDSDDLKKLCRIRNQTSNTYQRASLSRHIIATRRAERTQWLQNIYAAAPSGDTSAIAFLKQKHKPRPNWSHFISRCDGPQGAIHTIQEHFQQVFANTPLTTRDADCSAHLHTLQTNMGAVSPRPIDTEELQLALEHLQPGKTSGPSGMSNEFLIGLGQHPRGQQTLLHFLNTMLREGKLHDDLLNGIACLIPKITCATSAAHIRPILLLEVMQKLYAGILLRRINPQCPPLSAQVGAVPGGQPIEALFAAHSMLAITSVTHKTPLFLKLDIKGAFDNLRHASVLAFLANLPEQVSFECMRLAQLLLGQRIQFSFLQEHWELHCSNGTPQGGSHSAGLFARTLDHAIGKLLCAWEARGETALFTPLWLLLYVDDILLCFDGWNQAARLLPSFVNALADLGLHINYSKSCLVLSPGCKHTRPTEQQLHLLKQFHWVEQTHYLRQPFGCNIGHSDLQSQALQLAYRAWGKLKSMLRRCHWQHPFTTVRMMDQYVAASFLWLSPVLYPHETFRRKLGVLQTTLLIEAMNLYIPDMSDSAAHQLLRLRRHVVKRWLLHMSPNGNWDTQFLRRYWSFVGHVCRQDFQCHHPARIMLHHLAHQHTQRLSRPGPWNTAHNLLVRFWADTGLDGDYMHMALDRDTWRTLTAGFLAWHGLPAQRTQVELLDQHPWDSPKYLLRVHASWLRTIFVAVEADTFKAVWLDQVEGFSVWRQVSEAHTARYKVLANGLESLCYHLPMLGRPFLLQIVLPKPLDWQQLQQHSEDVTHVFNDYASWYQLFPLTTHECRDRHLRHCLTLLE